jgi:hypothetical protein
METWKEGAKSRTKGYGRNILIKGVVNSRDTNTAAEKYSRLYGPINIYLFKIYNMGYGKQALSSILERHSFLYFTAVVTPARGPTSFLPSGHWAHYHFTESPAVKVTTLVPMLRMHGATLPVPIMTTWRSINNSNCSLPIVFFSLLAVPDTGLPLDFREPLDPSVTQRRLASCVNDAHSSNAIFRSYLNNKSL